MYLSFVSRRESPALRASHVHLHVGNASVHQPPVMLGFISFSPTYWARIRAVLYMAAVVGTRYNPHVKAVYERLLARGKSKMSSLGAAMRKLVHLCFGVLKNQQPYQYDYLK